MSSLGRTSKGGSKGPNAVDLVTGKATKEYFFDPSLILQTADSGKSLSKISKSDVVYDKFFQSKHLFMPCTIIKPLNEESVSNQAQQQQNKKNKRKNKKNRNSNKSTEPDDPPNQPVPGPTLVKTSDGVLHKIVDSTKLVPMTVLDYEGVDDVLHLQHVTEASLLHTLRLRYRRDDVYTAAGHILISINPYKTITNNGESIYSESKMMLYRKGRRFAGIEKPPHLFQTADRAYTALMDSVHKNVEHHEDEDAGLILQHPHLPGQVVNQSIIISGESGAGKTEATKIIMKFLARITRKHGESQSSSMVSALEDRVLSSNPLLETFGNAQTLRNNNSSRFGKFIHIYFSCATGSITGASISNYLLEKTRITHQVDGERNYHIFYQLLSGGTEDMLKEFGLEVGALAFRYLGNKDEKCDADAQAFRETISCLTSIGLSLEEQQAVFGMAAAVLHLGNIQFESSDDDSSKVSESTLPSLKKACELLGLDEDKLAEAVLTKIIVVNGKIIHKKQNVALAEDKRDALAKMTYSCLFLWLVSCVNEKLNETSSTIVSPKATPTDKKGFIGVLDIYGFETFETNGFEQLLINYCNEKLQRHFNRHLFEVEQELYSNEGVDWTYITFNDNRPCLELIEGGGGCVGVLSTLDDAWGGMGSMQEKDAQFSKHLHGKFGIYPNATSSQQTGHPNFVSSKVGGDREFGVLHYAGPVKYSVEGFVEKNMETLSNELRDLGDSSTHVLSKKVYSVSIGETSPSSSRSLMRGISVGSQFRTSLQSLVSDLEQTQPHYIRCVKPNSRKASGSFMSGEVLKQLRYSGMMEAIRIRQEGYALREEHESFFDRFSVLLNPDDMKGDEAGIVLLVKALSKRLGVSDADWQVGHSKIFLRRELSEKLDRLARLRVHCAARTLTKFGSVVAQKNASQILVLWVRFRLLMLKKHRLQKAAEKIGALTRGHRQRKLYAIAIKAAVRIQSQQRRILATHHARKIQDPFYDLTFRDCKKLLADEELRLERAVKDMNFNLAKELEVKIQSIKDAIEDKRPLSRDLIDERIAALQQTLEDAVKRKAYSECGLLQDQLEQLQNQRAELPTIEELKDAISAAEMEMSEAAKNRDFAGAAEAQTRIDEARARLLDALADQSDEKEQSEGEQGEDAKEMLPAGYESRAQLESDINDLSKQLQLVIEAKDFSGASSLQLLLDEKEALRKFFPTASELQSEIDSVKAKIQDAVGRKDFEAAGALNDSLSNLEAKLKIEKSKRITISEAVPSGKASHENNAASQFESRADLEEEILKLSEVVAKCVGEKDFEKAKELQEDVDRLTEARKLLPSVAELQTQLKSATHEMNKAIADKNFAQASELQISVQAIEEKLKLEASLEQINKHQEPHKAQPPKVAKVVSITSRPVTAENDVISVKTQPVKSVVPSIKTPKVKSASSVVAPLADASRGLSSDFLRPVARLRPAIPSLGKADDSILSATKLIVSKRGNACVVVDGSGGLAGILTETDITRRVVAKDIDPTTSTVSEVMTPNPTCVSMSDSAMDALSLMVENCFRHLPVVDNNGSVVGLLDIAKCLNDAISKLEKASRTKNSTAENAMKQVISRQGGTAQAAALQVLLGDLMAKAFGVSMPTLRSVLQDKLSTNISPDASVREASQLMAERKKAVLVVDEGKLIVFFGFRELMMRVVAKELPLTTPVSESMTLNPEVVNPDTTVLEALQIMHLERCLTLPCCEDDGTVLGVVDIMDVMYACGGADGWKSIFGSAMEVSDDHSDASSVHSFPVSTNAMKRHTTTAPPSGQQLGALDESTDTRPVAKLRPSKPTITSSTESVLQVTKSMSSKRASASLITNPDGSLAGIMTATDVTRRIIAKRLDVVSTTITDVMTRNPKCVAMSDSAMEAFVFMVDNRFRHLPVLDEDGSVCGILDIAKCLNSVISKLERVEQKNSDAAKLAVKQVVDKQGAMNSQADALQQLLGSLMSQAFGNQSMPTLRSLLADTPKTVVSPETSVFSASQLMAERRRAALVVDDSDQLVGIFGFKDMMNRVVAKGLSADSTILSEVMTSDPETVTPDITVLEALQICHDNGILTLPVCEKDGAVVGLVDVMDIIYGCGGTQGWRAIFTSMMDIADDGSESASVDRSVHSRSRRVPQKDKSVAKLRPSKAHISEVEDSVLTVTQLLKSKRGSASLVVDVDGGLAGILTDTDITRRVVAKSVDPARTNVSEVMTANPKCVSTTDSATDALTLMVENKFRHLPVIDKAGCVVGVLDIAKCLNDAISKLEYSSEKRSSNAGNSVMQAINQASGAQSTEMQALLGTLLQQAFGSQTTPSIRSLVAGKSSTIVSPSTSIREAGVVMAELRKAALVVDQGELVGIFGFKDMMNRAVATGIPLDSTNVSEVMTPNPEAVSPDITILEALQIMHDNRFLNLPVCEADGAALGVVTVMDVICACGGAEGWRSIFDSAMDLDDVSATTSGIWKSTETASIKTPSRRTTSATKTTTISTPYVSDLPPNIPSTLEFHDDDGHGSFTGSTIGDERGVSKLLSPDDMSISGKFVVFKVSCPSGNTHRIRCEPKFSSLLDAISAKIDIPKSSIRIEYKDDEGDVVVMSSDYDVSEAWNLARKAGEKLAKLKVMKSESSFINKKALMVSGGFTAAALLGVLAFAALRPKK